MTKLQRRLLVATAGISAVGALGFAPAAHADEATEPPVMYGPCDWNDLGTYGQDTTTGAIYHCENIGLAEPWWMIAWA